MIFDPIVDLVDPETTTPVTTITTTSTTTATTAIITTTTTTAITTLPQTGYSDIYSIIIYHREAMIYNNTSIS